MHLLQRLDKHRELRMRVQRPRGCTCSAREIPPRGSACVFDSFSRGTRLPVSSSTSSSLSLSASVRGFPGFGDRGILRKNPGLGDCSTHCTGQPCAIGHVIGTLSDVPGRAAVRRCGCVSAQRPYARASPCCGTAAANAANRRLMNAEPVPARSPLQRHTRVRAERKNATVRSYQTSEARYKRTACGGHYKSLTFEHLALRFWRCLRR